MRRFTNSICLLLGTGWLAAGCNHPSEETAPVLPLTREPLRVEQPQPQSPKPVAAPTRKQTATATNRPVAQPLTAQQTVERLKAWDKKLRFLSTSFTQTTEYDGIQVSRSQGVLYYDQEHQWLRLDTLGQNGSVEQTAVTDKKEIIILDDSGKKVTTLSWQEWQAGQPNQALFDFGNYTALVDRHNTRLVQDRQLALTPKEGEKYTLYITLAEDDFFPTELKIESDLLLTRAQLIQTQKNKPLEATVFGGLFK